ncbi:hypothetical protein K469DRAFT_799841 [Zopfia rhizophila CBS 207.26]|uniref:Uncharacterized protein n=1 Tax=Zopfia rhizophila CBS 207.26 TaxID=1314779 RepID=A0A6A6EQ30_9PEZI|nr:hypothetical protein K469DRAFT_799841 [Zopfia rhizophila CBS 207.26]
MPSPTENSHCGGDGFSSASHDSNSRKRLNEEMELDEQNGGLREGEEHHIAKRARNEEIDPARKSAEKIIEKLISSLRFPNTEHGRRDRENEEIYMRKEYWTKWDLRQQERQREREREAKEVERNGLGAPTGMRPNDSKGNHRPKNDEAEKRTLAPPEKESSVAGSRPWMKKNTSEGMETMSREKVNIDRLKAAKMGPPPAATAQLAPAPLSHIEQSIPSSQPTEAIIDPTPPPPKWKVRKRREANVLIANSAPNGRLKRSGAKKLQRVAPSSAVTAAPTDTSADTRVKYSESGLTQSAAETKAADTAVEISHQQSSSPPSPTLQQPISLTYSIAYKRSIFSKPPPEQTCEQREVARETDEVRWAEQLYQAFGGRLQLQPADEAIKERKKKLNEQRENGIAVRYEGFLYLLPGPVETAAQATPDPTSSVPLKERREDDVGRVSDVMPDLSVAKPKNSKKRTASEGEDLDEAGEKPKKAVERTPKKQRTEGPEEIEKEENSDSEDAFEYFQLPVKRRRQAPATNSPGVSKPQPKKPVKATESAEIAPNPITSEKPKPQSHFQTKVTEIALTSPPPELARPAPLATPSLPPKPAKPSALDLALGTPSGKYSWVQQAKEEDKSKAEKKPKKKDKSSGAAKPKKAPRTQAVETKDNADDDEQHEKFPSGNYKCRHKWKKCNKHKCCKEGMPHPPKPKKRKTAKEDAIAQKTESAGFKGKSEKIREKVIKFNAELKVVQNLDADGYSERSDAELESKPEPEYNPEVDALFEDGEDGDGCMDEMEALISVEVENHRNEDAASVIQNGLQEGVELNGEEDAHSEVSEEL